MCENYGVKTCARCSTEKPLDEFHRQPKGPQGRHSWCKPCVNKYERETRNKKTTPEQRRRWGARTRYGITHAEMLEKHGNQCGICGKVLENPVIDHSHTTGQVRGLLCHRCNLMLPAVEDEEFRTKALAYLALSSVDFRARTCPSLENVPA